MSQPREPALTDWTALLAGIAARKEAQDLAEAAKQKRRDKVAGALKQLSKDFAPLKEIVGPGGERVEFSHSVARNDDSGTGHGCLVVRAWHDGRGTAVYVDELEFRIRCGDDGTLTCEHDDTAVEYTTLLDLVGAWVLHHFPDLAPAGWPVQTVPVGRTTVEPEIPF